MSKKTLGDQTFVFAKVWSLLFLGGYSLKVLEERIKQDGVVLPGNVLKVNQFLNHQIDPQLMYCLLYTSDAADE